MKKYLLIILLVSVAAQAKDDGETNTYAKYGVGIFKSAEDSAAEVKTLAFGRQTPLDPWFIWQWELGVWSDTRDDQGRKSNAYGDVAFGLNVNILSLYFQSLWGVAALARRDSYLNGNAQFNQDLGIGFRDKRGVAVGFNYKHISSAGIFMPNVGRDFGMVKLSIPW